MELSISISMIGSIICNVLALSYHNLNGIAYREATIIHCGVGQEKTIKTIYHYC